MKIESGSFGNISKQNQKSSLEKQLDFQEAVRPAISDEYYTSVVDFIDHLKVVESRTDVNNENTFPKEFKEYMRTIPSNSVLGNGAIKTSALRIQHLSKNYEYNIEDKDASKLIKNILKDTREQLGFATSYEYNKDSNLGHILDSYIACFPGRVTKNEKGEWTVEEDKSGSAKFFALMVVRGLVSEEAIMESGMATLGVRGIKFSEDFKQALGELKKKQLEKFTDKPLV